jgi:hypothetical protein
MAVATPGRCVARARTAWRERVPVRHRPQVEGGLQAALRASSAAFATSSAGQLDGTSCRPCGSSPSHAAVVAACGRVSRERWPRPTRRNASVVGSGMVFAPK